ncbi:MAG: TetR/AcrR family transcriptional regulator [Pseudomonadota bacterium]
MPRKANFSDESVYAAVGAELMERGTLTVDGLKARTGLSIGSIYHRFGSREGLMAATWLAAVSAFQDDFHAAIEGADLDRGVAAALATPRFCRRKRALAVILACCRRSEFLGAKTPAAAQEKIAGVNERAAARLRAFASRVDRPLLACRLAIVDLPVAAVRACLPGDIPPEVDGYVARCYTALLTA